MERRRDKTTERKNDIEIDRQTESENEGDEFAVAMTFVNHQLLIATYEKKKKKKKKKKKLFTATYEKKTFLQFFNININFNYVLQTLADLVRLGFFKIFFWWALLCLCNS
jgi:hypothetical protein